MPIHGWHCSIVCFFCTGGVFLIIVKHLKKMKLTLFFCNHNSNNFDELSTFKMQSQIITEIPPCFTGSCGHSLFYLSTELLLTYWWQFESKAFYLDSLLCETCFWCLYDPWMIHRLVLSGLTNKKIPLKFQSTRTGLKTGEIESLAPWKRNINKWRVEIFE